MANEGSVGGLAAKLIVDSDQAKKGLKEFSDQLQQPIGLIKQLESNANDLMKVLGQSTNPTTIKLVREELTRTQQVLQQVRTGAGDQALAQEFTRPLGIIEELKQRLTQLQLAKEQATNPLSIKLMNDELEKTRQELAAAANPEAASKLVNIGVNADKASAGFRSLKTEIRNGREALLALSFIANTLSFDGSDQNRQKFNRSLQQGVSTAIGMSFALRAMGGSFEKLAGPVGIVLGIITTLISALRDTNEAAQEAAKQGLQDIQKMLEQLSSSQKATVRIRLLAQTGDLDKVVKDLQTKVEANRSAVNVRFGEVSELSPGQRKALEDKLAIDVKDLEALKQIQKELDDQESRERVLNRLRELARQTLQGQLPIITAMKIEQEQLAKAVEKANTPAELQKAVDQLAAKQREIAEAMKSTDQRQQDIVQSARAQLEINQLTTPSYLAILRTARALTEDKKTQLAYDVEINRVIQSQVDLEAQREQKRKDAIDRQGAALTALQDTAAATRIENIPSDYDRKLEQEAERHLQRMIEIEQQAQQAGEYGVDAQGKKILTGAAAEAQTEEDKKNRQAVTQIEIDGVNHIRELRIDAIADEETKMEARYQLEESKIEQLVQQKKITEEEAELLQQGLRIRHANDLTELEKQRVQTVLDGVEQVFGAVYDHMAKQQDEDRNRIQASYEAQIAAIDASTLQEYKKRKEIDELRKKEQQELNDIQSSGLDDAISKMKQILLVAKQVAALMALQKEGKDTLSAVLDIGISVLPLLLAKGGEIPGGSYVVNERMSDRYKELLDALGASEVEGGTPHKDSVVARSTSGETIALTPKERILPPALAPIGKMINEGTIDLASYRDFVTASVKRESGGPLAPDAQSAIVQYPAQLSQSLIRERIIERDIRAQQDITVNADSTPVILELRDMRKAIQNMKPQVSVVFKNLLEGQQFLQENFPQYSQHEEEKKLE